MIDAVVLWVDSTDLKWQQSREEHWQKFKSKYRPVCESTNNIRRFYNGGELRYCLRSLYHNVSWLRTIYLVTNGQRPSWLDVTHPKIKLVNHSEIMPKEHLPTFNSSAIEMNLHKIPELSDVFLYLNDDFFITRKLSKNLLFDLSGRARYHSFNEIEPGVNQGSSNQDNNTHVAATHVAATHVVATHVPAKQDSSTHVSAKQDTYYDSWNWILKSDMDLLNRLYGKGIRNRPFHQAFMVYRENFFYLTLKASNVMETTSSQQFRPDSNGHHPSINIYAVEASGLERGFYQLTKIDKTDQTFQKYVNAPNLASQLNGIIKNRPYFLCINNISNQAEKTVFKQLMERLLPNKAPWEV